ncbi:unnamed protein product [Rhizoctonia solani]|uniref:Uncharacterized protein n=1 Tax=Rhizoctonia solani TaxID=456999 RepID=A0A8H3H327_9AGAM|nr:unnamed protein product [Rhizoctonia solani]CAE6478577.1 unnamed protein product [Rhizoctonia solani]
MGNRPQLVHHQPYITKPSGWVRLAIRLGLTKGSKLLINAVENSYKWISHNYRQGDQVASVAEFFEGTWLANVELASLVAISRSEIDTEPHLNAAAILVNHIYKNKHAFHVSKVQARNGGNMPSGRIPIYSIAVQGMRSVP